MGQEFGSRAGSKKRPAIAGTAYYCLGATSCLRPAEAVSFSAVVQGALVAVVVAVAVVVVVAVRVDGKVPDP
mgnify:CR=1 FL=1